MQPRLDVAVAVSRAPVTGEEIERAYAEVMAELGVTRCCPHHPAELTPAEIRGAALAATELIAEQTR
jgi:hypothetical protein